MRVRYESSNPPAKDSRSDPGYILHEETTPEKIQSVMGDIARREGIVRRASSAESRAAAHHRMFRPFLTRGESAYYVVATAAGECFEDIRTTLDEAIDSATSMYETWSTTSSPDLVASLRAALTAQRGEFNVYINEFSNSSYDLLRVSVERRDARGVVTHLQGRGFPLSRAESEHILAVSLEVDSRLILQHICNDYRFKSILWRIVAQCIDRGDPTTLMYALDANSRLATNIPPSERARLAQMIPASIKIELVDLLYRRGFFDGVEDVLVDRLFGLHLSVQQTQSLRTMIRESAALARAASAKKLMRRNQTLYELLNA